MDIEDMKNLVEERLLDKRDSATEKRDSANKVKYIMNEIISEVQEKPERFELPCG